MKKRWLITGTVVLVGIVLLLSAFFPATANQRSNLKMSGEDVPSWKSGDRWKWHLEIPMDLPSINGYINLHIDLWGNYTGIINYNVSGTLQKCYYVTLEGWGLGDGSGSYSGISFDLRANGDSSGGSSGYNSNVPFRVLGHRIVRVSDLADVEMRVIVPTAWVHAYLGWLIGYDEMEIKLDAALTFWNESKPYVPDNMDFPVNVGEKMWFNANLHTYGYMWNSDDSAGYISEKNNTFDENATWNYTFDYTDYHQVTVSAGTFWCYNATGTNGTGVTNLFLEYSPETKWYVKETYKDIAIGSSGYMSLLWELTDYSVSTTSNLLTLSPNEVTQADSMIINGTIPSAAGGEVVIAVPEYGWYVNLSADNNGSFTYTFRVPLFGDATHTSIDFGSVGIVAYNAANESDLIVATLTVHKLPSHIIYGYVIFSGNMTANYTNMSVVLTNNVTGDSITIPVNTTTGYFEYDISWFFYGYRDGEEIYGEVFYNNYTYTNSTLVDIAVNSQRMDIGIYEVPEFPAILILLAVLVVPAIFLRKE